MSRGLPLEAFLVVDNSLLVMLTDFYCETRVRGLATPLVIGTLQKSICDRLAVLKQFALGGCLYCSDCVAAEFQPWNGRLKDIRGIAFSAKQRFARDVVTELQHITTDPFDVQILRNQPDAPSRLVGPGGLSDEDLSLVAVGISLTERGEGVYLLSNDQDLLDFVTWLRRKPEAQELWPAIKQLQGLHSLTYLELVHRNCRISTDDISELIQYYMRDHYGRANLVGTTKGQSILDQLLEVQHNLVQSVAIKAQLRGAVA